MKSKMNALQKREGLLRYGLVPQPLLKKNEVLIKIATAGICRTDISVMKGTLGKDTVIPGHEFSGYIEIGNDQFQKGDAVAVNPVQSCQVCTQCKVGIEQLCQFSKMMGVDYDGAFAEYIAVRADLAYKIPPHVSMQAAAFIEPIAANLAVFNAGLLESERGGILGNNRIANLIKKIMDYKGYSNVDWLVDETQKYDYLIETHADEESMNVAIQLLKPRGRLIIKSRNYTPTPLVFSKLIAKEIQCVAVNYGRYDEAISLLNEGLFIDDLFGQSFDLDQYETAIKEATRQESSKVFLCAAS